MSAEHVNCNSCGAPLAIAPHVNFITCSRCNTPLAVRRTGASTFTERAASPTDLTTPDQRRPAPLPPQDDLSDLQRQTELNRLENQLNRLNLEWEREKEGYMLTGRYGHRYLPEKGSSALGGIVIAGFGILWTIFAFGITSGFTWSLAGEGFGPPPIVRILFPLFGVLFVISGIAMSIRSYNKAEGYEKAHAAFRRRHSELLDQIDEVRRQ